MAKIISMQEVRQNDFGPAGGRKQTVRFIVSREFVGHQTMEDAFSRLIEHRTEEQYGKWRDGREAYPEEEQALLKAG